MAQRLEDYAAVGVVVGIPVGAAVASVLLGLRPRGPFVPPLAVVDETKSISITVIGEALARLSTLKIGGKQLDGTTIFFDVLAGEVPSAVPGVGNLLFRAMAPMPFRPSDVTVINDGISGTVFMRVVDDAGTQILYLEGTVAAGHALFMMTDVTFNMPSRDYKLTVEAGHV